MADIHDLNVTDASNIARFPENMPPSDVNDGARALEGMIARYYYDMDSSVSSSQSGTVIVVTANRDITNTTSATYLPSAMIAWKQTNTKSGPLSINVTGSGGSKIGIKTLRDNRGTSLSGTAIMAGARCLAVYDAANDYFRLLYPASLSFLNAVGNFGTAATAATGTSGTTVPLLDAANTWSAEQINTAQAAFLAHPSGEQSNATGNSTVATVVLATEVFDVGANFATNTFTANLAGRYMFCASVNIQGLTIAASDIELTIKTSDFTFRNGETNNETYEAESVGLPFGMNRSLTVVADMDANDTAYVTIQIDGEAGDVCDIQVNGTHFSGYFLG